MRIMFVGDINLSEYHTSLGNRDLPDQRVALVDDVLQPMPEQIVVAALRPVFRAHESPSGIARKQL